MRAGSPPCAPPLSLRRKTCPHLGFYTGVVEIIDTVTDLVGSPSLYVVAALCVVMSAIVPPVPSTSLFVALGAMSLSVGAPRASLLIVAMTVGSVAGDVLLWWLGSLVDFHKWRLFRSDSAQRRLEHLSERVHNHTLLLSLVSRYIPLGRTSAGLVAGSVDVPFPFFAASTVVGSLGWAFYSVGVGWITAQWLPLPTYLTVILAIVVSLTFGALLSRFGDHFVAMLPKRSGPN